MKLYKRLLFSLFLPALAVLSVSSVRATTVYALTQEGAILTFDHTTPGTITNNVIVTGLSGYTLLSIDERPTVQPSFSQPGVGTLWAIGQNGTNFQLFVIDPVTGVATPIGFGPITPAGGIASTPGNNEWGFDFNPTLDRIRLVNSSLQGNYVLNPNNGNLLQQDGNLAYAAGDLHEGTTPQVDGTAYATQPFGTVSTVYFIDSNLDILARGSDITNGKISTIGALGVDISQPNGFDILGNLALISAPNGLTSTLYSVNLTTGLASSLGSFPIGTNVRSIAIQVPIPPVVVNPPFLRVVGKAKRSTTSSRVDLQIRSYDDSGTVAVSFRQTNQSQSYKFVRGTGIDFTAIVRRLKYGSNPVIVRAVDPDGNTVTKRVVIVRNH